jgi:hypothetical protein
LTLPGRLYPSVEPILASGWILSNRCREVIRNIGHQGGATMAPQSNL